MRDDDRTGTAWRARAGLGTSLLMGGLVLVGALVLWFRYNVPEGKVGQPFPYDFLFYYFPMMEYASERLAQGELPLWNPYHCCGVPFLATSQVAVFYPCTWLALVMSVESALRTLMFCEVLLGSLFAGLFFRALGASGYAAGLGGVLFMFACLLGQTIWPPEVSTILWIPFLFLCVERFVARGGWMWWAAFTLATTLQVLAGFPQFLVYGFYLLGPYAIVRLIGHYRTGRCQGTEGIGRCAGLGAGCALALGLAGIQVLPTLELVNNSARAQGLAADQIEYLEKGTTWKPRTLTDIVNNAFDPNPKWIAFDISYGTGYVGMATLFLIGLAVVGRWREPLTWFFVIAAVVSLVLSFGYQEWSGGVYKLYAALPTGGMFRTPGRFRLLTFFSLISLAVLGIDQFRTGFSELRKSAGQRFAAGLVVVGLLAATIRLSGWLGIVLAFAAAGVLAGSFFLYWHRAALIGLQVALLLLLAGDLIHATARRGSLRDIPVGWGQSFHHRGAEVIRAKDFARLARDAGLDRVCMFDMGPVKPIRPLERVYTIYDLEALVPRRWVEANRVMEGGLRRPMIDVDPHKFAGFYDMAGVKFLVSVADMRGGDARQKGGNVWPGFRLNTPRPQPAPPFIKAMVRRNADALPRAYLVGRFELCEPADALSRVARAGFDYRTTVLLEKDPQIEQVPEGTAYEAAEIVSYAPERVVIRTGTKGERILVLTDTYFPGWKAFVDGAEREILRANYLFRAVRVPAGQHEVVFEYRPGSLTAGAALSGASFGFLVVLCGIGIYLSRQRQQTEEKKG